MFNKCKQRKYKINLISNEFEQLFESSLDDDKKNITVIIGEDLKIITFFRKNSFFKKSPKNFLFDDVKIAEKLNSKISLEEIRSYKSDLSYMVFEVNKYRIETFLKNDCENIKSDVPLFNALGKCLIFKGSFVKVQKIGTTINLDENNFKKFINVMEQLEKFIEKCKNLIKNDITIAKLFLTACLALQDYLELNVNSGLDKDLIDLIDFKEEGTIYNSAYENNIEFILDLNKESFLYPVFLQFNSGFKKCLYDNKIIPSCMISKITLQQIRLDLIRSLDRYGIRIFFKTIYLANTTIKTRITIYNEILAFGKKLNENELLSLNDTNYHKRVSISFLQKHERFSHLKKIFNKNEINYIDSPRGYIDYSRNKFHILARKSEPNKGEIGETLEFFLSSGNIQLIDNLYYSKDNSFDFKNLFNVNILLEKTNEKLVNILRDIPEIKEEKGEVKEENNKSGANKKFGKYKIDQSLKYKIDSEDDNIEEIDKYVEAKNKLMNENTFRKFTFERNTICSYKFDHNTGQLVPEK